MPEGGGATPPRGLGPGQAQSGTGEGRPMTRRELREQAAAEAAAAEARAQGADATQGASTQLAQLQAVSTAREAAARETNARHAAARRAAAEAGRGPAVNPFLTSAEQTKASEPMPAPRPDAGQGQVHVPGPAPRQGAQAQDSQPTTSSHGPQASTSPQGVREPAPPTKPRAGPAVGTSGTQSSLLSRRALREQAAAQAAAEAAARPAGQPAPVVAPPAVTGAIRALDETGQLTPAQPVSASDLNEPSASMSRPTPPVPPRTSSAPGAQRPPVGGRRRTPGVDASAEMSTGSPASPSAPSVPSAGSMPTPGSAPSAAFSPSAGSASAADAAGAGVSAGGKAAIEALGSYQPEQFRIGVRDSMEQARAESEPREYPLDATTPNPAAPTWQRTPLFTDAPSVWAPVTGEQPTQALPAQTDPRAEQDAPSAPADVPPARVPGTEGAVPQWGSVLDTDRNQVETPEEGFGEAEEEVPSSFHRYSPLQYVVLVVIGLVLGVLVWQLINPSKSSEEPADGAPAATSFTPEWGTSKTVIGDL